jgi:hypothetical protein
MPRATQPTRSSSGDGCASRRGQLRQRTVPWQPRPLALMSPWTRFPQMPSRATHLRRPRHHHLRRHGASYQARALDSSSSMASLGHHDADNLSCYRTAASVLVVVSDFSCSAANLHGVALEGNEILKRGLICMIFGILSCCMGSSSAFLLLSPLSRDSTCDAFPTLGVHSRPN